MKNHSFWLAVAILFASLSLFAQQNKTFFEGAPIFHGATTVGNYPNTPFLHTIATTGERPITFAVTGLPAGLQVDAATGFITGQVDVAGEYTLHVTATNAKGTATENIKLSIGKELALTPVMGWNSWNVFASDIDENIIMRVADAMATNGMRNLGYEYINLDDYWHADKREKNGKPIEDAKKFPHGMKALCDYVHSKGLKIGIYSCAGTKTCGKRFGSFEYEDIDAKTYAEWGFDLLKYDYCFAPKSKAEAVSRYRIMGNALRKSGRSIVFSICEWGGRSPYKWGQKVGGQYWRTTGDIDDDWKRSVVHIIAKNEKLAKYAGPGHWNDPDMLLVGNYGKGKATSGGGKHPGCTDLEYQSHMSLWCLFASPLLASNDLSNMNDATYTILTNPEILAINQDPLGKQAEPILTDGSIEVFYKEMADGSVAIGVFNKGDKEEVYNLSPGLNGEYTARDVWAHTAITPVGGTVQLSILPHETKVLRLRIK